MSDQFDQLAATASLPALLPATFYESRPELQRIEEGAYQVGASRDAVLGAVLARVACQVSPHIGLPDVGQGRFGSLNLISILLGPSGSGKGTATNVSTDLVYDRSHQLDMSIREIGEGSGEGLGASFVRSTDPLSFHDAVLQVITEGEVLTAHRGRTGNTFMMNLRKAWSCEGLGEANAVAVRPQVKQLTYRYAAIIGFQPATAGPMLDDVDGGTPQRFVWFNTIDPAIPEDRTGGEIRPIGWTPPRWENSGPCSKFRGFPIRILDCDRRIASEIRKYHTDRNRGRIQVDPLDTHRYQSQLRVASLLCLLAGRLSVSVDDWDLAAQVMDTSDGVRHLAMVHSLRRRWEDAKAKQDSVVSTEVAKVDALESRLEALELSVVHRILGFLDGGPRTRREIKDYIGSRGRRLVGPVLRDLEERELICRSDNVFTLRVTP